MLCGCVYACVCVCVVFVGVCVYVCMCVCVFYVNLLKKMLQYKVILHVLVYILLHVDFGEIYRFNKFFKNV